VGEEPGPVTPLLLLLLLVGLVGAAQRVRVVVWGRKSKGRGMWLLLSVNPLKTGLPGNSPPPPAVL